MLFAVVEEKLDKLSVTANEFSELVIRLLDYGVINRDESQVEGVLYDRYLQCSELLEDYLSIIKVKVQHDRRFCFIRVFPPGAVVPGMQSEGDTNDVGPFNNGFRSKPSQQEVAVIIVLRVEYEKALREGQIDDKGCAMLSLEGLALGLNNLLKRSLPDSHSERKNVFRHLRQLRLIRFNNESDFESEDSWLSIQPGITSFVSEQVLTQLQPQPKSQLQPQQEDQTGEVDDVL
ncbi:MAG: hypothetical protein COB04_00070 [Gammaproteobacteria bacterium]|nr:MAG: hypothetical protein COB04_00070 [Gammaproteobacteria bacterium]